MSRITVKEAAKLTGLQPMTIYQQINRGTNVGQLFAKDKHGHWRADEKRVISSAKEYKRKIARGSTEGKIGFRITPKERKSIEVMAKKAGLTVAEWCRSKSLDNSGPT